MSTDNDVMFETDNMRITWQYKCSESTENDSLCAVTLQILQCTAGSALYENKEVQHSLLWHCSNWPDQQHQY